VARHLPDVRAHDRLTIHPNVANERAMTAYRAVGFKAVGVLRNVEWDRLQERWTDGLLMDLLDGKLVPEPGIWDGGEVRAG
jgi:RimJ/RimL family protein N-acetyltransferase